MTDVVNKFTGGLNLSADSIEYFEEILNSVDYQFIKNIHWFQHADAFVFCDGNYRLLLDKFEGGVEKIPLTSDIGSYVGPAGRSSIPIASTPWFFKRVNNFFPETSGKNLDDFDVIEKFKNVNTLRPMIGIPDTQFTIPYKSKNITQLFVDGGIYILNEMRYEIKLFNRGFEHVSSGPTSLLNIELSEGDINEQYYGYLAFPFGHLGVMEVISIVSETMMDDYDEPSSEEIVTGAVAFAPKPTHADNINNCIGAHIIEGGYAFVKTPFPPLDDGETYGIIRDRIELKAEEFSDQESAIPLYWLRYWISPNDGWPIPGEYIGLVCKPLTNLFPIFYQETIPFLHSGNWFETEYYTSGEIIYIHIPNEPDDGNTYTVHVKGSDLRIKSTDYYQYAIGDRVAIIKKVSKPISGHSQKLNFKWSDLEYYEEGSSLVIAPIVFYQSSTDALIL